MRIGLEIDGLHHPTQVYREILTRTIDKRMRHNSRVMEEHVREIASHESFMLQLLDEAVQDRDSFARGVELIKVPPVNTSVLYCGIDLVAEETPEKPPTQALRREDQRMRDLAETFIDKSPAAPVPENLLWPYYQDALLKHTKGPLSLEMKKTAEKIWERDQDKSKRFYTSFFW